EDIPRFFQNLFGGAAPNNSAATRRSLQTLYPGVNFNGHAEGGYTGPGGKYEPAGIVHRGEYVIPKKHVNQTTGLPDLNYVQSLQRSKPASTPGYASGGFVGGAGGPIELGVATMHALARQVSVNLN